MTPKYRPITQIEYIIVTNGSPIVSPILPPKGLDNDAIEFIKRCPTDLAQLMDPLNYLEIYLRNLYQFGTTVQIFDINNYFAVEDFINNPKRTQLFFLDESSEKHLRLYEELQKFNSTTRFFNFYNRKEDTAEYTYEVTSPVQFMGLLVEKQKEILVEIGVTNPLDINPSVPVEFENRNRFIFFIPTRNNYFLLNKILGNFGDRSNHTDEEIINKGAEEAKKATLKKHSFDRQNKFIDQIKKIDSFFHLSFSKGVLELVGGFEPYLPPLILVAPFHNPDLKQIYGNEDIIKLLQVEQNENYTSEAVVNNEPKLMISGMKLMKDRLRYLDDVSFLHSSFTFSPTVRLPVKGSSIYRELSFFRPKVFPNISVPKNRRNLKKTIHKFGKALSKATVSPNLANLIKHRNGQIVAISDLPVEWTLIDDIPLSFTHDVCRLPETSLHGLMSFYANNQLMEFTISSDILKKTLVILGEDEEAFAIWHQEVYRLQKEFSFVIAKCKSKNEVKEAIQKFKPDLLIFDCHGGYDEKTRSTYLFIGKDKLDGDFIVKNQLFAPIVFLSACGTAPTYGTMNPIANAFFETGTFSVTSTFLPISVVNGSILYLRILYKLDYASKHAMHKNWLEFIGHLIRTSSVNEAYRYAKDSAPKINNADFFSSNVNTLTDSLDFYKRRRLYETLDSKLSTMTQQNRNFYSEIVPEYLMYTNLGRGDLILFESWKDKYLEKNAVN